MVCSGPLFNLISSGPQLLAVGTPIDKIMDGMSQLIQQNILDI